MNKAINESGVSLVELLVIIGLLTTISFWGTLNVGNFQKQSALSNSVNEITTTITTAKSKSIAGELNLSYKVHFLTNSVSLLDQNGATKSTVTIDKQVEIVPPGSDITFARVTGSSNGGTVVVRLKDLTSSKQITVSSLGIITVN